MVNDQTFLERIGYHWICVAPASILCGDRLVDEDGKSLPSLRESLSKNGLFCLQVYRYCPFARLYWAFAAADPDQLGEEQAQTIVLNEEQLRYALPWDCRLQGKSPARILTILYAHARKYAPMPKPATASSHKLHPSPVLPLEVVKDESIAVQTEVLQEQIGPPDAERYQGLLQAKCPGAGWIQQALLRAILNALSLKVLVARFKDQVAYQSLQKSRALVARIQRWQRKTRQRVVNAVPIAGPKGRGILWQLMVGEPVSWTAVA